MTLSMKKMSYKLPEEEFQHKLNLLKSDIHAIHIFPDHALNYFYALNHLREKNLLKECRIGRNT